MVLKLEQLMGSKNSVAVLRHLVLHPYASFGLTELALALDVSKSNILRVIRPAQEARIVIERHAGHKKLFKINSEHELVRQLWGLYQAEKRSALRPEFKNIIDLFFNTVKERVEVFVLFGSVARGLATKESDIDILIVGDKKLQGPILDYLPFRFEVHHYSWEELEQLKDFVVIEAMMNGISYKGEIYDLLKRLKVFPKAYLIYRLNKVKGFLHQAKKSKGPARKYYSDLAIVTCGEIGSLLGKKGVQPKRFLKTPVTLSKIEELERSIAQEGEGVWIT